MTLIVPRLMTAALLVIAAAAPAAAVAFDAGFKSGGCFANISGDIPGLENDFTMRNGFSGGIYFDFKLGDKLSIQPEAIYMQKGSWIKDIPFQYWTPEGILEGDIDYEFRIWYFEFPILIKYTMRTDSFLRPYLYGGPAMSYTQRAVVEITQNIGPYSWGVRDDVAGQLKKWDFGATLGGGLHFAFGSRFSIFLEGRYNLGLINLNDTEDDITIKTRAITALIGLNIRFVE
jgi:opacity protein-like surface antigen